MLDDNDKQNKSFVSLFETTNNRYEQNLAFQMQIYQLPLPKPGDLPSLPKPVKACFQRSKINYRIVFVYRNLKFGFEKDEKYWHPARENLEEGSENVAKYWKFMGRILNLDQKG